MKEDTRSHQSSYHLIGLLPLENEGEEVVVDHSSFEFPYGVYLMQEGAAEMPFEQDADFLDSLESSSRQALADSY